MAGWFIRHREWAIVAVLVALIGLGVVFVANLLKSGQPWLAPAALISLDEDIEGFLAVGTLALAYAALVQASVALVQTRVAVEARHEALKPGLDVRYGDRDALGRLNRVNSGYECHAPSVWGVFVVRNSGPGFAIGVRADLFLFVTDLHMIPRSETLPQQWGHIKDVVDNVTLAPGEEVEFPLSGAVPNISFALANDGARHQLVTSILVVASCSGTQAGYTLQHAYGLRMKAESVDYKPQAGEDVSRTSQNRNRWRGLIPDEVTILQATAAEHVRQEALAAQSTSPPPQHP